MDLTLLLLDSNSRLVSYSQERGSKGSTSLLVDLKKGSYNLTAYLSPCYLINNNNNNKNNNNNGEDLIIKKNGKYEMTLMYKEIIADIFDSIDLNGGGLLDKKEFQSYTKLTCGEDEDLEDDDWAVVLDRVDSRSGKITKTGFLDLHRMDIMDCDGDTSDMLDTLSRLGYNNKMELDKASHFIVELSALDSEGVALRCDDVNGVDHTSYMQMVKKEGTKIKSRDNRNVNIYIYVTDHNACIVVDNQDDKCVVTTIDCSSSRNVRSHQKSLRHSSKLPPNTPLIFHHIVPINQAEKWILQLIDTVQ
ncbi:hypothetical protein HELRODRAFT_178894 [Helobdella robusta]|uniref:EF-hand domain-containing protein n=1 Tax=Helobdella robusta TaxID=6412 RepID=T1FDV3_HELRO|nr:hypothetical protein HELRODRAFT_178894 [Helobdella robusta]ESN95974.1 hypothetical protein HELRODRAFT_178894 [Helobdella robusta]